MNTFGLRRVVAVVALVVTGALVIGACSIPTEDQPQQINREQTTTTVATNP